MILFWNRFSLRSCHTRTHYQIYRWHSHWKAASAVQVWTHIQVCYLCVSTELKLITLIKYGSWFCRTQQTQQHIDNISFLFMHNYELKVVNQLVSQWIILPVKCQKIVENVQFPSQELESRSRNLQSCGSSWLFVVCLNLILHLCHRKVQISARRTVSSPCTARWQS